MSQEIEIAEMALEKRLTQLSAVSHELSKVIVGQQDVLEEILVCMLAGGHCLLEGVPGLAKTLMVSSLAKSLDMDFHRVQFTPDLMPSDIIGTEILEEVHATGKREFNFVNGPVFTNLLLADEINRTPPKTQAALLEAMQEKRVTYAGKTYQLPKPFFVLATQNPVEQSGTYPLPEAQLDRFLMFVRVDYPTESEEQEILRRTTGAVSAVLQKVLSADEIAQLQTDVREVVIAEELIDYIIRFVRATRPQESGSGKVRQFVRWGAGPRAGQALVLCAKARALIHGRLAVTLDDVLAVIPAVLRHRILLNFQAEAEKLTTDNMVEHLTGYVVKPQSKLGH